ncbi:unnamed protein product [Ixodes pacificus]
MCEPRLCPSLCERAAALTERLGALEDGFYQQPCEKTGSLRNHQTYCRFYDHVELGFKL